MTAAHHPAPSRSSGVPPVAAVLGVLGEVLITLGVLLGLFVVWQLWWTDVLGERAQAQVVEQLAWEPAPGRAVADPLPVERDDAAPVLAAPDHATTFATLQVPRWGGAPSPISEGVTKRDVLDTLGIGHYPGTAMPGGVGNFAVAGHRTTYGKPFNRIEELAVDDALVVRTETTWYVYRVTGTEIVSPRDVDVIDPVPGEPGTAPTLAQMTLTTCHPMFSARQRYVVHAVLATWLPVEDGTPAALEAAAPTERGA